MCVCVGGGGGGGGGGGERGGGASLEEASTCFYDIAITLYNFSPLKSLIGEGIQQ